MSIQQVQTDDPRFIRDIHSKALLNTDYVALQQHRREQVYFQNQQNDINILKNQVHELSSLREEMIELKVLLKKNTSKSEI
jgi:TusA-related sulfurtransferase